MDIFFIFPLSLTCFSRDFQWKQTATLEFDSISLPFLLLELEKKKEFKAMDDGTYAVGEDGAEIKDDNLSVRDILQQNEGDASVAEVAAMDDRASKEGDKKRIVKKTSSMDLTKDEDSDQLTISDIIGKKEVQGDQLKDGSTSSMLKSLESESAKSSQNSVINVQNNTNQTNSCS